MRAEVQPTAEDGCGRDERMAERSRKLNTNAGFSLIELIVAVIIMSVLAGSAVIGISQVMKTNVTTAVEKLAVMYDRAQYDNFYLDGEVILRLEYVNENYEAVVLHITQEGGITKEQELSREKIADKKVEVTAVTSGGGATDVAVTPVTIAFYKSSGAMKTEGTVYSGIRLQNAARKAELVLVEHTGRCFVDAAPDW